MRFYIAIALRLSHRNDIMPVAIWTKPSRITHISTVFIIYKYCADIQILKNTIVLLCVTVWKRASVYKSAREKKKWRQHFRNLWQNAYSESMTNCYKGSQFQSTLLIFVVDLFLLFSLKNRYQFPIDRFMIFTLDLDLNWNTFRFIHLEYGNVACTTIRIGKAIYIYLWTEQSNCLVIGVLSVAGRRLRALTHILV